MSLHITELSKGVQGYYIENSRFNTTLITYNFYLPLEKENMAVNALLPYLLTSCSEAYPDYIDLNVRLLELYGADLSCSVSKCGDCLHIKAGISVVNNGFSFDSSRPVEEAAELLTGLLFAPAVRGETFFEKDVAREKRKTVERIEGEINNKRAFARTRLMEEMFGPDPYGKFIYGTVDEVNSITAKELFSAWRILIETAFIRVIVVGKELPAELWKNTRMLFDSIRRENVVNTDIFRAIEPAETPRDVTERFEVTQGKLAMGFTSEAHGDIKDTAALSLFADIFGGGPYSKLFENVREKQSLCYYCAASARRTKGFVTVESGIEEENADKTVAAVLKELEDIKQGNFDQKVIDSSKKSITDALSGYYDSATAIDTWYSRDINDCVSPEQAADLIKSVTKEEIVKAAGGVRLHTVYRLLPEREDG